jgi:hypothetical protein
MVSMVYEEEHWELTAVAGALKGLFDAQNLLQGSRPSLANSWLRRE